MSLPLLRSSLLHEAAAAGNVQRTAALLQGGANPNLPEFWVQVPLRCSWMWPTILLQ